MSNIKKHSQRINTMFNAAKDVPPASSSNAKIIAGIYIRNELVGLGFNQLKSSPFQAKYGRNKEAIYFHAETHSIKQALKNLPANMTVEDFKASKTTLYVARAKKTAANGDYVQGLACPCTGCQKALIDYNIKTVVYTDDFGGFTVTTPQELAA